MKWRDFEKEKPPKADYYLCKIWGFSSGRYGNLTEYKVEYYHDGKFSGYPVSEYDGEKLGEYFKVINWCNIDEPERNLGHYKYPDEKDDKN